MPTLGSRGASWLGQRLDAAMGVAIKYRRDAGDCELTAVPGRRASEDIGADGAAITSTDHDWIVDPALLVIDGEAIEPRAGDLIVTTSDDKTFVVVYADGEHCWRYTDQFRQRIRIHTIERCAEE